MTITRPVGPPCPDRGRPASPSRLRGSTKIIPRLEHLARSRTTGAVPRANYPDTRAGDHAGEGGERLETRGKGVKGEGVHREPPDDAAGLPSPAARPPDATPDMTNLAGCRHEGLGSLDGPHRP